MSNVTRRSEGVVAPRVASITTIISIIARPSAAGLGIVNSLPLTPTDLIGEPIPTSHTAVATVVGVAVPVPAPVGIAKVRIPVAVGGGVGWIVLARVAVRGAVPVVAATEGHLLGLGVRGIGSADVAIGVSVGIGIALLRCGKGRVGGISLGRLEVGELLLWRLGGGGCLSRCLLGLRCLRGLLLRLLRRVVLSPHTIEVGIRRSCSIGGRGGLGLLLLSLLLALHLHLLVLLLLRSRGEHVLPPHPAFLPIPPSGVLLPTTFLVHLALSLGELDGIGVVVGTVPLRSPQVGVASTIAVVVAPPVVVDEGIVVPPRTAAVAVAVGSIGVAGVGITVPIVVRTAVRVVTPGVALPRILVGGAISGRPVGTGPRTVPVGRIPHTVPSAVIPGAASSEGLGGLHPIALGLGDAAGLRGGGQISRVD